MRKINSVVRVALTTAFVVFTVVVLSHCDKEPDLSESLKKTFAILESKEWRVHSVKADGIDRTEIYKNMKVTFRAVSDTKINFVAINGEPIWPGSGGVLQFNYETYFTLQRLASSQHPGGPWVSGNLVSIDESVLVLTLDWQYQTIGSGREKSVNGEHVFTLSN